MAEIAVEVVYALPERQALLRLSVPAGTSAREAVLLSGIGEAFPGLDVQGCPLGIF
ncbi:TPA: RnfH family protein, partial [Pseudomonas aeruginosa]|nr:RnfH family protein [Pseudomonas aeruginosa]